MGAQVALAVVFVSPLGSKSIPTSAAGMPQNAPKPHSRRFFGFHLSQPKWASSVNVGEAVDHRSLAQVEVSLPLASRHSILGHATPRSAHYGRCVWGAVQGVRDDASDWRLPLWKHHL